MPTSFPGPTLESGVGPGNQVAWMPIPAIQDGRHLVKSSIEAVVLNFIVIPIHKTKNTNKQIVFVAFVNNSNT